MGKGFSRRCGALADEIYPLIAPAVIPETIFRWKNMNMMRGGIVMMTTSAKRAARFALVDLLHKCAYYDTLMQEVYVAVSWSCGVSR